MTTNSDSDRIGARWRDATRPVDSSACPPAQALDSLVLGTTPPAERAALLEHAANCAACSAALAALDALQAQDRERAAARPRRTTMTYALAAAAAIVLALGAILSLPRLAAPPGDTTPLRGPATGSALEPAARARLAATPRQLRFEGMADAASARVRILAHDGSEVWISPVVHGNVVDLPDALRAQLDAGGSFAWEVLPEDPATPPLGPFWFTVEP